MAPAREKEQFVKVEGPDTSRSGMCVITVCVDPASADNVRQAALHECCIVLLGPAFLTIGRSLHTLFR